MMLLMYKFEWMAPVFPCATATIFDFELSNWFYALLPLNSSINTFLKCFGAPRSTVLPIFPYCDAFQFHVAASITNVDSSEMFKQWRLNAPIQTNLIAVQHVQTEFLEMMFHLRCLVFRPRHNCFKHTKAVQRKRASTRMRRSVNNMQCIFCHAIHISLSQ